MVINCNMATTFESTKIVIATITGNTTTISTTTTITITTITITTTVILMDIKIDWVNLLATRCT